MSKILELTRSFFSILLCFTAAHSSNFGQNEDIEKNIDMVISLPTLERNKLQRDTVVKEIQHDTFQANEPQYTDFSLKLPVEIWNHISSFLDYRAGLHMVNYELYDLIVDYPLKQIHDRGLEPLVAMGKSSKSNSLGIHIDFKRTSPDSIPSYILHSFVTRGSKYSYQFFFYEGITRIVDLVSEFKPSVIPDNVNLGELLVHTQIHEMELGHIDDNGLNNVNLGELLVHTQVYEMELGHIDDNGLALLAEAFNEHL